MTTLFDLPTPSLVLDRARLERNCRRISEKAARHGVDLRPHLKTAKCVEVARIATRGCFGGVTVSTLREAEYFVEHGFLDVTYAVGIAPNKFAGVAALQRRGAVVSILLDSVAMAREAARFADADGQTLRVFIEIDPGYHRAGIQPDDPALLGIARALTSSVKVELRGVLAHGGHSYAAKGIEAVRAAAEEERAALVKAANRLRAAGFACPVVSGGSTPGACLAEKFEGLTEIRPGNYTFFDVMQAGIGSCSLGDIAVFVAASVIGHKPGFNRALIDAGALALSKDFGGDDAMPGAGYGLICELESGALLEGVRVGSTSQEHGWLSMMDEGAAFPYGRLPIGAMVRVLPGHSCLTAAAYDRYYVVDGGTEIVDEWERVNGW